MVTTIFTIKTIGKIYCPACINYAIGIFKGVKKGQFLIFKLNI